MVSFHAIWVGSTFKRDTKQKQKICETDKSKYSKVGAEDGLGRHEHKFMAHLAHATTEYN